ncbi:S-type anion channel SLAH2 [Ananas comosus]|uniref:S-type anion channel SLAH2 n=1 Tax=Ananas comosus TaxID=4615 RepID=A0A199UDR5_ANACO|nr:S-type anion channel SLAH2 [Ananas comosus]
MEKKDLQVELGTKECFEEALPPVLKLVSSQTVAGFDCGTEVADTRGQDIVINLPELSSPIQMANHSRPFSLSFSLPSSPSGLHIEQTKTVIYTDKDKANAANSVSSQPPEQGKYHSQPMPVIEGPRRVPRSDSVRDKRFDPFKTWSGRLERQLSNLRGKPQEATEVSVLPEDEKWPFLLRFPVNAFGICLGVSGQAILWKTLATSPSMTFLHVSPTVNLVLWFISLALMGLISLIYSLKVIFYFEAVRREYYHPVRVNFFFAPWITCLFLAIGVPPSVAVNLPAPLWYRQNNRFFSVKA